MSTHDLSDRNHAGPFKTTQLPGIDSLWKETLGDPEIPIAVLDGPVDLQHPCFAGATLEILPSLVPQGAGPSNHGTHVASQLFGRHDSEIPGIAPQCKGLILPVFAQTPEGSLKSCSQQDLARAISMAVEAGARIINISGGELTSSGAATDFLTDAVRQAADRDILIVSATGNEGCECLHVPAALPTVLPVGALDLDGRPLESSNWSVALEGIMAPGAMIAGAVPGNRTGWMTGTSFAAPLVSGIAALLMSLQKKYGLPVDAAAVRGALIESANPCDPTSTKDCRRLLRGALNIRAAQDRILAQIPGPVISGPTISKSTSYNLIQPFKGAIMSESINPSEQPQGPIPSTTEGAGSTAVAPSQATSSQEVGQVIPACAAEAPAPPATEPAQASSVGLQPAGDSALLTADTAIVPRASSSLAPAVQASTAPMSVTGQVTPSCQGMPMFNPFPPGQKAFPVGKLYYDFGTEARRDYFIAQIRSQFKEQGKEKDFNQGLVYDPLVMIKYLFRLKQDGKPINPDDVEPGRPTNQDAANGLIWTLYIDQDPVYALVPEDQFAVISFVRLTNFLMDMGNSKDRETFRVAVAGTVNGSVTLFNGTVVPQLSLVTRGMFDWDIDALIEATCGEQPAPKAGGGSAASKELIVIKDLKDFLLRIYQMLRNQGVTSEERAKNFAATNAYQARGAFVWANSDGRSFKLDTISAAPSPICRRNSDCWDIKLVFFDPNEMFQTARQVFEYTIDVSDLIPVQVGEPRVYPIYGGPNG